MLLKVGLRELAPLMLAAGAPLGAPIRVQLWVGLVPDTLTPLVLAELTGRVMVRSEPALTEGPPAQTHEYIS